MGYVAEDKQISSFQAELCTRATFLPTHPFIAEVPPPIALHPLLRDLGFSFLPPNPSPIGPGL